MNGLLNLMTSLSTFIIGPFGQVSCVVAIAFAFFGGMFNWMSYASAGKTVFGAAGLFSAAWIVTLIGM